MKPLVKTLTEDQHWIRTHERRGTWLQRKILYKISRKFLSQFSFCYNYKNWWMEGGEDEEQRCEGEWESALVKKQIGLRPFFISNVLWSFLETPSFTLYFTIILPNAFFTLFTNLYFGNKRAQNNATQRPIILQWLIWFFTLLQKLVT